MTFIQHLEILQHIATIAAIPYRIYRLLVLLDEDIADSKHELIRGNVVMATRYFHHRVKSFISKIVMSKSNPMKVRNYTYKVEFQERGNIS